MYMCYKYPSTLHISRYRCAMPLPGASHKFCDDSWNVAMRHLCLSSLYSPGCFMTHLHVILDIFYCRKINEKYSPESVRTSQEKQCLRRKLYPQEVVWQRVKFTYLQSSLSSEHSTRQGHRQKSLRPQLLQLLLCHLR